MKNKNPFGIPKNKDEWEIYKNRELRVCTPNDNYVGKFDGITETGYLHLKPSLSQEGLMNPDGTNRSWARIEREVPTKVSLPAITGVIPLSKGYTERLADSINSVPSSRLITPYFRKSNN